jgi:hypothetical protein
MRYIAMRLALDCTAHSKRLPAIRSVHDVEGKHPNRCSTVLSLIGLLVLCHS